LKFVVNVDDDAEKLRDARHGACPGNLFIRPKDTECVKKHALNKAGFGFRVPSLSMNNPER
jgi:hypothetical protein